MPIYTFRCEPFGIFEQWRVMGDFEQPAFCPECRNQGKGVLSASDIRSSINLLSAQESSKDKTAQRAEKKSSQISKQSRKVQYA